MLFPTIEISLTSTSMPPICLSSDLTKPCMITLVSKLVLCAVSSCYKPELSPVTTHWQYPVPSRKTINAIPFPSLLLETQPFRVTLLPMCWGKCSMFIWSTDICYKDTNSKPNSKRVKTLSSVYFGQLILVLPLTYALNAKYHSVHSIWRRCARFCRWRCWKH